MAYWVGVFATKPKIHGAHTLEWDDSCKLSSDRTYTHDKLSLKGKQNPWHLLEELLGGTQTFLQILQVQS